MTSRELRAKRKIWKEKKKNQREKSKDSKKIEEYLAVNSPESLISEVHVNEVLPQVDGRSTSGKKRARKAKAKVYRELNKYKEMYVKAQKKAMKYKKRFERLKNRNLDVELTPNSKISKLMKDKKIKDKNIRKRLLFGEVVGQSIRKHYSEIKTTNEKQLFRKFMTDQVVKKYKLATMTKKVFHFDTTTGKQSTATKVNKRNIMEAGKRLEVRRFLERDDNSTLSPGKKDTITRQKIKRQIRYLNDSLRSLHLKFTESTNTKMSYQDFCKKKPFWVIKPDIRKRDTCLCIKHSNMAMLTNSMFNKKILEGSLKEVVSSLTCSPKDNNCLMRLCKECKNNTVNYGEFHPKDSVIYQKWVTVAEKRTIKGIEKEVKFIKKESFTVDAETIVKEFEKHIIIYMKHLSAISHQYQFMKNIKENLRDDEVVIHMDFSENFACKYNTEVQSVHFGASRSQVTIHTGVAYYLNNAKDSAMFSFSSVSPSLRHDPSAVWAHLEPVIQECFLKNPKLKVFHFVSDSPTTQYRNRKNFFLLQNLNNLFPKVTKASWNFSEAGHGKGALDGIGAVLKRTADRLISEGADITSADNFFDALVNQDLKVKMYKVSENDIEKFDKILTEAGKINPIPGTMSIRQVAVVFKPKPFVNFRTLGCNKCGLELDCDHFKINMNTKVKTGNLIPLKAKVGRKPNRRRTQSGKVEHLTDKSVIQEPTTSGIKRQKKLTVEEVYSSQTEDEDDPGYPTSSTIAPHKPHEVALFMKKSDIKKKLACGTHILVEYKGPKSSKCKSQTHVGICQGELNGNGDIEVMFMKPSDSDSLFYVNQTDVSLVNIDQIIALMPIPKIIMKGDRMFYSF